MERKRMLTNRKLRKTRVRARVSGTTDRPRLAVTISNRHVHAQLIDDEQHRTIVTSSTVGNKQTGSLSDKAAWAGADIAKKAKKANIKQVVLDRGHKQYHGRVAEFAEAARKEGLEF